MTAEEIKMLEEGKISELVDHQVSIYNNIIFDHMILMLVSLDSSRCRDRCKGNHGNGCHVCNKFVHYLLKIRCALGLGPYRNAIGCIIRVTVLQYNY